MANRVNRYKTIYERMVRPNNGAAFPRHVFVRAANLHASLYDRVGDRYATKVMLKMNLIIERTALKLHLCI
jgi:hypothetical protein